jgi:hypothetical protein
MTKNEFSEAVKLAKSDASLSNICDLHLHGCGLPEFQPVHTSLEAVAKLVRYQCAMLNGGWDERECNDLAYIAKRKFLIVG